MVYLFNHCLFGDCSITSLFPAELVIKNAAKQNIFVWYCIREEWYILFCLAQAKGCYSHKGNNAESLATHFTIAHVL